MLGVEEDGIQTGWQAESGKMEEACFKFKDYPSTCMTCLWQDRVRTG